MNEEEIELAKTIYQDFSHDQFHKDRRDGGTFINEERTDVKELKNISELNDKNNSSYTDIEKSAMYVTGFEIPEPVVS